ncbi:MAG: hypothetical protein LAN71_18060 [Acidobacteriia bacterium]|nr:hypothetical protein [Terriglobia bacterium]
MPLKIKNLDFRFENSLAKIIAERNYPEIKLAGLSIGPLEEGNEYEVYYWIAQELAESGIAHFREDGCLDATKLYKVQWKERVQIAGQISELTEDFYPKLRRYLANIKRDLTTQPEKAQEYEKAKHLACDIVNSRLKKIVALSAGPAQTDQVLRKFTSEERLIYEQLGKIISEWRTQILECEGEG